MSTSSLHSPKVETIQNDSALARSSKLSLEFIHSWDFNALELSQDDSFMFLEYLFLESRESSLFSQIPWSKMSVLLREVMLGYRKNSYHRWEHAIDVTHTVYRYLDLSGAHAFLTPADRIGLLIGAVMHDVGHNAVNNQFLIESGHELAGLFNDRSPLENFHCFKFFSILKLEGCNIFESFSREQIKQIRAVIIEAVIHTDNMYHFGMVKDLQTFISTNSNLPEALKTSTGRVLMTKFFLHSADISNPTKPFALCKEWAYLVMEEFFAQGDQEKLLGLSVQPLNDRANVNIPQTQLGFIEFFVTPLELCKVRLFPKVFNENALYIVENMAQWATEFNNDTDNTLARCDRVKAQFNDLMNT